MALEELLAANDQSEVYNAIIEEISNLRIAYERNPIRGLVGGAIAAGWRAAEVLTTIIEFADNHALMLSPTPNSKVPVDLEAFGWVWP
jgi:hypothetical protein